MSRICITLLAFFAGLLPVNAHLSVEGGRDNLVLEADQAPLGDVLDALGVRFDVNLKSTLPRDLAINGRFSGTLDDIIKRLFFGYDFVVAKRRSENALTIEVVVSGRSGTMAIPPPTQRTRGPAKFDGFK